MPLQDDPINVCNAPSKKAWVEGLTVVSEADFRRYVISRHIKTLIDPTSCRPMPHGRDKWDLMAAEILAEPELASWPVTSVEHVMKSEVWSTWTPKQRFNLKNLFGWRFGWAFYFGTVQVSKAA